MCGVALVAVALAGVGLARGEALPAWPAQLLATKPPVKDRGVWSDLDARVTLHEPAWLRQHAGAVVVRAADTGARFVMVDDVIVGFAGPSARALPVVEVASIAPRDADGDGIPDTLDTLIGARKTAINAAPYGSPYRKLDYPSGDIPRNEGVCTDVLIRALRNSGLDLQKTLYEDIGARPRAFAMVKRRNPNIDHRRVKTLLPHFQAKWEAHEADIKRSGHDRWLPGDVVFMQTMGDPRPDHVGVVSDRVGPSGYPLVINNWTDGYHTQDMDLLAFVKVTHRFRRKRAPLKVAASSRGLDGLLTRRGLTVGEATTQAIVVTGSDGRSAAAVARRYVRASAKGAWRPVGPSWPVALGSAGLGVGRGLHGASARLGPLPPKREGDRRAPAGVFALGEAFGPGAQPAYWGRWPWKEVGARTVWVDDPAAPTYNTRQQQPASGPAPWRSAERLSMYPLGLVVQHNTSPVQPGAGSAIFLHPWVIPHTGTLGCTAMDTRALKTLLTWLDPAHHPVLIQTPGAIFE